MRLCLLYAVCALAVAQVSDPAHDSLEKAYSALRGRQYERAISFFWKGIDAAPGRAAARKDLAYTYLKIGENEAARSQFREAMRLDPADFHVALEYAFLCYETGERAEARRVFDRVRQSGDPASRATAERAFQNIDRPLKTAIARWEEAIALGADNFGAHYALAVAAADRGELELAARHYEKAWRLHPDRRSVLVDLGRSLLALNRDEEAHAALLAASRGGEPRAAEAARALLPPRYPYVYEFRKALALDPANAALRRELGFLFLQMGHEREAIHEFETLTAADGSDLLSAAQLGFLYLARKDLPRAMPLLERVLHGSDPELADRVRAVLHMPQLSAGVKFMAARSMRAGYLRDALKYLRLAHDADPADFSVVLELGWTCNMLHDDVQAVRWFDLARSSPDPKIAAEAGKAFRSLRPAVARFRTTAWFFPSYSSRWNDLFSYGQVKVEANLKLPVHPYLSLRLIGDTRRGLDAGLPQYLSESSVIVGFGLASRPWNGITLWGETGSAISYRNGHRLADYRGGAAFYRTFGHGIRSESPGWFFDTGVDGLFISRFNRDTLLYAQNRLGYTPSGRVLQAQLYWNLNVVTDSRWEYWANFGETGPGVRFHAPTLPDSLVFSFDFLRGAYTRNQGNPRGPNFFDIRAGFSYAISR